MGISQFVDTLGAVLAPLYGILVADYYLVRKQRLDVRHLFTATVWVPALANLTGFAWIIGAADAESPGCARGIRGSPTSD